MHCCNSVVLLMWTGAYATSLLPNMPALRQDVRTWLRTRPLSGPPVSPKYSCSTAVRLGEVYDSEAMAQSPSITWSAPAIVQSPHWSFPSIPQSARGLSAMGGMATDAAGGGSGLVAYVA